MAMWQQTFGVYGVLCGDVSWSPTYISIQNACGEFSRNSSYLALRKTEECEYNGSINELHWPSAYIHFKIKL